MNDVKTEVTASLIREIISTYNHYKGQYKMNSLKFMTTDDIVEQITKDLNEKNQVYVRNK